MDQRPARDARIGLDFQQPYTQFRQIERIQRVQLLRKAGAR